MNFCIIDYKLGNIKSIQSLLSALKINSYLSSDSKVIEKADVARKIFSNLDQQLIF